MLKLHLNKKITFWSITAVFVASYILLGLQTVTSGAKFALLEKEEESLNKKNRELTALLMQTTSLSELSQKSESLGFIRPENTIYISKNETVAQVP